MRIKVPLKCAMCCMESEPSYYTRIGFECDETRICTDTAYRGKIARSLLEYRFQTRTPLFSYVVTLNCKVSTPRAGVRCWRRVYISVARNYGYDYEVF